MWQFFAGLVIGLLAGVLVGRRWTAPTRPRRSAEELVLITILVLLVLGVVFDFARIWGWEPC